MFENAVAVACEGGVSRHVETLFEVDLWSAARTLQMVSDHYALLIWAHRGKPSVRFVCVVVVVHDGNSHSQILDYL